MNLKDIMEHDILHQVEKPSRYLGTELNSVHKHRFDPHAIENFDQ